MKTSLINELIELTKPFVGRSDLIQGPGGNTSVKNDSGLMIIKASGYRFEEVEETKGYSIVENEKIRNYFFNLVIEDKAAEERISNQLIQDCIALDENKAKYPKPSMETGFHAVLDKYVVHTHSVWTNLLNCNQSSQRLLSALKEKLQVPISYIPFVSPGLGLSYLIAGEIKNARANKKPAPKVFFLENHGIIAHGESAVETTKLLEDVDRQLRELFNLEKTDYLSTELETKNGNFYPVSDRLSHVLERRKATLAFFDQVLFPDQTVFFNSNISFDPKLKAKINIANDYSITYSCNPREASSIHETMTAFVFIYDTILKSGDQPRLVASQEVDYINNMDMEKYRKSLMN